MTLLPVVRHDKRTTEAIFALVATVIFGRMAIVAAAGAFENPAPTAFQQLAGLWDFFSWIIPALLIGATCAHRVIPAATIVSLTGGCALLLVDYRRFAPTGSMFADAPTHWAMAMELGIFMARAIILAVVVQRLWQPLVRRWSTRAKGPLNGL